MKAGAVARPAPRGRAANVRVDGDHVAVHLPAVNARRSRFTSVLAVLGIALALVLSLKQGLRERVGHDFHVFWQAGYNFATGHPLYHDYLPGARQFKYPPFAAFVFQPLAALPLQLAGALFSLLNLGLWVVAIYLTREIVARTLPDRSSTWVPVAIAGVLSAQFFLDNFRHVQVNGLILVLVLLGIRAYLNARDLPAAAYLVTATAIKVSPVFFVAWLVIRGRRRAALAVPPLAAACVLVPLLVRGPASGLAELREYYDSFLSGHQHAEVSSYTRGHNIASFVNRMTLLVQRSGRDMDSSHRTAGIVHRAGWMAVALIFIGRLLHLRLRRVPISPHEMSTTFLVTLMLSPITFTANLVSLLFVFCALLSVRKDAIPPWGWPLAGVLLVAMAMTGLSGKELAGRAANQFVREHGIFVLTMLLSFAASVALAGRKPTPVAYFRARSGWE